MEHNRINRIIVPLDGSELSEQALPLAQSLARALGAQIELVHILEEPIAYDLVPSLVLPDRMAAERYLAETRATLAKDIDSREFVVRGNPAEELIAFAAAEPGATVVMSTHGRGGLGRVVYGSVADKVTRTAAVPVVLVRAAATTRAATPALRDLLVPLDGSELSEAMLPLAVDLARASGAALHVVRVVEPAWAGAMGAFGTEVAYLSPAQVNLLEQELLTDARQHLDGVTSRLRADDVRVVWEVRIGKPAEEITRAAQTIDADLILMSSHGRGGIRRWAFGSVANEVLQRSAVPVMIQLPHASTDRIPRGVNVIQAAAS
jgi:nucleotide-binding universal stress UspA family protein